MQTSAQRNKTREKQKMLKWRKNAFKLAHTNDLCFWKFYCCYKRHIVRARRAYNVLLCFTHAHIYRYRYTYHIHSQRNQSPWNSVLPRRRCVFNGTHIHILVLSCIRYLCTRFGFFLFFFCFAFFRSLLFITRLVYVCSIFLPSSELLPFLLALLLPRIVCVHKCTPNIIFLC